MKLAIIGAGIAGLAAARSLRSTLPDLEVTLYEKSRGLGGRVATRRRDGYAFDHGAQCFKAPTDALLQLIQQELPSDELFDIGKPIWVFDGNGTISEGDPAMNAEPKWSYRSGLNMLGKLLGAGLDVRREVRIAALKRETHGAAGWSLIDSSGSSVGWADLVLITAPGPQTAEILAASDIPAERRSMLVETLQAVVYRRCISFAFAYPRLVPRPFYALINTDRGHPIAWLALEHDKGFQRCPPGHSLMIAQMAPAFSLEYWDMPIDPLAARVASLVGDVLGEDLDQPLWADRQGWKYALPDGVAAAHTIDTPELGLFFAGDFTAGQGRVHLAIEQGWRAAATIAAIVG
jgi:predicted NAD/FAD-dependent oxidoreductase